jgi:hypothetical protein
LSSLINHFGIKKKKKNKAYTNRPTRGPRPRTLASTPRARAPCWFSQQPPLSAVSLSSPYSLSSMSLPPHSLSSLSSLTALSLPVARHARCLPAAPRAPRALHAARRRASEPAPAPARAAREHPAAVERPAKTPAALPAETDEPRPFLRLMEHHYFHFSLLSITLSLVILW